MTFVKERTEDERPTEEEEEKKERQVKANEAKDTMCICMGSMYDEQISPEVFGTMVCASCSQSTDPWLRFLHTVCGLLEEHLGNV